MRPTADRVKEALFSILGAQVVGARVLDLYAGTGALGIEALSRGAASVTFVEDDPRALHVLRDNLRLCGIQNQADVRACRVEAFLSLAPTEGPYQLLFADPPYRALDEITQWSHRLTPQLLTSQGTAVVEHARKDLPCASVGPLRLARTYAYGDSALSVYREPAVEARA